eukprot:GDKI01039365.1.p1 GENE.GDKI01039365.1~~GDKI01039365.1.p1  ORF type:complete len:285 (+),score=72.77 GDKI01039365.1:89-943(+)
MPPQNASEVLGFDGPATCAAASTLTCPIARLNDEVRKKMLRSDEIPQLKSAPQAVAAVRNGAQVYHNRSMVCVVSYLVLAFYFLYNAPNVMYGVAAVIAAWMFVDFYGGVLHVVLDHPPFVDYPVISAGCLEFQWHHVLPYDITAKPYLEVCGDLNLVLFLHIVVHAIINGGLHNHAGNAVLAAKILAGYFGQWAHRMAHTPPTKRPSWVLWGQKYGILVSPEMHRDHHTTYNDGFPILSGFSAPLVAYMCKIVPDRHVWLAGFLLLSFTDIYVVSRVLSAVLL